MLTEENDHILVGHGYTIVFGDKTLKCGQNIRNFILELINLF